MIHIKNSSESNFRKNPLWIFERQLKRANKPFGVIYMYVCKSNGKKYIGQTVEPYKRHKNHIATSYRMSSKEAYTPFHSAIRKYGDVDFDYYIVDIVYECSHQKVKNKLDVLEKFYIYLHNTQADTNGYNVQSGGTALYSEPTDRMQPVAQYSLNGEIISTFASYADAARAVNGTPNVIKKASLLNQVAYQYRWGEPNKPLVVPSEFKIHQYSLNGEYLTSYRTLQEAAEANGVHLSAISLAMNNKNLVSSNSYWRKDKYKTLPYEEFPQAVCQYDLDGNFIVWYKNVKDAVQSINASGSSVICGAIKRHQAYKGFLWRNEKHLHIDPRDGRYVNEAAVIASYPDGRQVKFKTIKEAAEVCGTSKGTVNRSIRNLPTTFYIKFSRA